MDTELPTSTIIDLLDKVEPFIARDAGEAREAWEKLRYHAIESEAERQFLVKLGFGVEKDLDEIAPGLFAKLMELRAELATANFRAEQVHPLIRCECGSAMETALDVTYTVNGMMQSAFQNNEIVGRCNNEECLNRGDICVFDRRTRNLRWRFPVPQLREGILEPFDADQTIKEAFKIVNSLSSGEMSDAEEKIVHAGMVNLGLTEDKSVIEKHDVRLDSGARWEDLGGEIGGEETQAD